MRVLTRSSAASVAVEAAASAFCAARSATSRPMSRRSPATSSCTGPASSQHQNGLEPKPCPRQVHTRAGNPAAAAGHRINRGRSTTTALLRKAAACAVWCAAATCCGRQRSLCCLFIVACRSRAPCHAAHLQHIDFCGRSGNAPQRPVAGVREARLHVLRRQRQPHLQAREVPDAKCKLALNAMP